MRTQKNGRTKRTPTPKTKTPLFGGAELRRSRSQRKSLKKTADTGELCERATTLQEKRGHSRSSEGEKKKKTRVHIQKEKMPPPTIT
ncbi:hypothetical protein NDU88_008097 [Pleurodeles waltl]|uniref:Uncharacterized protein n=1 Tax=Pleurodeles waltl TaxID=8319 RepID=A0AAV7PQP6_PLEWA|nr:hypothetical protein NDU88_008096 [Pleurodeles waltl]KAJ1129731.1 hypothetical protein NDU88_008097 [Pleurodeles waltl]